MKREKITDILDYVKISDNRFYTRYKIQYIDLNNLNKYTKKELRLINDSVHPNSKKEVYIRTILKDKEFIKRQTAINRKFILNSILY